MDSTIPPEAALRPLQMPDVPSQDPDHNPARASAALREQIADLKANPDPRFEILIDDAAGPRLSAAEWRLKISVPEKGGVNARPQAELVKDGSERTGPWHVRAVLRFPGAGVKTTETSADSSRRVTETSDPPRPPDVVSNKQRLFELFQRDPYIGPSQPVVVELRFNSTFPEYPPHVRFPGSVNHIFLDDEQQAMPTLFYQGLAVDDRNHFYIKDILEKAITFLETGYQKPEAFRAMSARYGHPHASFRVPIELYRPFRKTAAFFDFPDGGYGRIPFPEEWLDPRFLEWRDAGFRNAENFLTQVMSRSSIVQLLLEVPLFGQSHRQCAACGGKNVRRFPYTYGNTLVSRSYLPADNSFGSFISEIKQNFLPQHTDTVFSFPFVSEKFCDLLVAEVRSIYDSGIEVQRPNSMNRYGVILNYVGMEGLMTAIQRLVKQTNIAEDKFGAVGADWDGHHSFIVQYAPTKDKGLDMHTDDSDVTFNICLGIDFVGSGVAFCGIMGEEDHRKEKFVYAQKKGWCLIHLGRQRHGAVDIEEGERMNLIIWNRGSRYRMTDEYRQTVFRKEAGVPDEVLLVWRVPGGFVVCPSCSCGGLL